MKAQSKTISHQTIGARNEKVDQLREVEINKTTLNEESLFDQNRQSIETSPSPHALRGEGVQICDQSEDSLFIQEIINSREEANPLAVPSHVVGNFQSGTISPMVPEASYSNDDSVQNVFLLMQNHVMAPGQVAANSQPPKEDTLKSKINKILDSAFLRVLQLQGRGHQEGERSEPTSEVQPHQVHPIREALQ